MHDTIRRVTERIVERSRDSRAAYLARTDDMLANGVRRGALSCGNLAHASAACAQDDKARLLADEPLTNIAIVTAYNDMLSAHQPYGDYPEQLKSDARAVGAVAQVAGGVPAMCDGVTQGQPGMELSLFSRDVIAMATSVALSHAMFDATVALGICDKIVPGLLIGALSYGHLPTVFVPAGPMPSGLPNKDKVAVREAYAAGTASRDDLLAAESASYHSPGTCTFYGTANSNQMLMEFMGLQLPGGSFVAPDSPLRRSLTRAAVERLVNITAGSNEFTPLAHVMSERTLVNGIIGLLATGGSTNHTIHLIAIARAAGIVVDWTDFAELSSAIPLLASVYPSGTADVNEFHARGGIGFVIRQLLDNGLLHDDVQTLVGHGLSAYTGQPDLAAGDTVAWAPVPANSPDRSVVREVHKPFQADGGIALVTGKLGRAVVKVSAVAPEHRAISAPAKVFHSQEAVQAAFEAGELNRDVVVVVTHQGPAANGMPELHKLSPALGVLQNKGFKVALLTDGRMSGASGKILAAIHVTPEAVHDGALGRLRDGDLVTIDAASGTLTTDADLAARDAAAVETAGFGYGRELFAGFRANVTAAEAGATSFG